MAPRHRPRPLFLLGFLLFLLALLTSRRIIPSVCAAKDPPLDRIRHGPVIPPSLPPDCTETQSVPRAEELRQRNPDPEPDPEDVIPPNEIHHHQQPQQPLNRADPGAAASTISPTGERDHPPVMPEYEPLVTPPPSQDAALATLGYKQMTYYTCNTRGAREHCGWHVPIVRAQGVRRDSGTVWIVVVCVAGVFALGLV
ncbi:hypothetical protein E4U55_006926 [Claviceps digitariae]|nr:hypothetical protein E4U55_006926 [Claviceps digitariae]